MRVECSIPAEWLEPWRLSSLAVMLAGDGRLEQARGLAEQSLTRVGGALSKEAPGQPPQCPGGLGQKALIFKQRVASHPHEMLTTAERADLFSACVSPPLRPV